MALLLLAAAVHQAQAGQRGGEACARETSRRSAVLHDDAHARRDARQAGRHRDRSRDDRHRPARGSRAESRRLLHQERTGWHRTPARPSIASCRQGIVQGGDPLSKDPSKVDAYGTGGLGVLRAERNAEKNTRGAVSAVVGGGNPDSGGTQFFICVADQPGLDGEL